VYEKPSLIHVGDAKDVVLGITAQGSDPDTRFFIDIFQFLEDLLAPTPAPGPTDTTL